MDDPQLIGSVSDKLLYMRLVAFTQAGFVLQTEPYNL
jgi:hypothetical protein